MDKSLIAGLQQQIVKGADYSQITIADYESNISLDYSNKQESFIADKWFPMIGVQTIAGLLPRWSKENRFTNRTAPWRPGSIPAQGELKVREPIPYVCERYGFEMPLAADIPFVASPAYDIERATVEMVTDVLNLNKEIIIADAYFKAGVWGIDLTGVNSGETWTPGDVTTGETFRRFNDADSDILSLFRDMKMAMKKKVGVVPDTLVVSEQVYETLRIHPQIIALYRNPQGADKAPVRVSSEMIARALDIASDKFLIAGAMKNTSAVGAANPVLDWIFGKSAWLGYVDTPGVHKTIAGLNLSFDQPLGGFNTALTTVPELRTHTTLYQGFQCFCPKVYEPDAGIFLAGCIP